MPKRPVSATHGAMNDMPTGMMRRSGAYSLRRRVPLDLIGAYGGRKEIVRALGTSDFAEAKRLHARLWVALDDEFSAHRQQQPHGPDAAIREKLRQIARARAAAPPAPPPSDAEIELQREQAAASFREAFEEECEYEAREFDRREILEILDVPEQFLDAKQRALKDILTDARWDVKVAQWRAESTPKQNPASSPALSSATTVKTGLSVSSTPFSTLIERWKRSQNPTPRTHRDHQTIANVFTAQMQVTAVDDVTGDHLVRFMDWLLAEGDTPSNIKTKLGRLKTLLSFAFKQRIIGSNPGSGIEAPKVKQPKPRIPWDRSALTALFDGPVHSEGARPTQGRGEAAYWMPLLALYSGARREELGQLRVGDIELMTYVVGETDDASAWVMHIRFGEDGGNHLKNAGSERVVPIHGHLIDLGFIKYVSGKPNNERLFPALTPDRDGKLTAKWGEWFSTYRREDCGITDKRIVFHSLRHSFKDNCREVSMAEGIQRQLMGHSSSDTADDYGLGYSTHQLVEAMRSYRVPGLRLPAPPLPVSVERSA